MRKTRLSMEETQLLGRMSIPQLELFDAIAKHKNVNGLIELVNMIIDMEKNVFFGGKELGDRDLAVKHAFARGGIAKLTELLHLIGAASSELSRRNHESD